MPLMQSPPGAVTRIDGRDYTHFVGTGYLGLQGHPDVIRAACEAAERYGIGSANSRTAFGTTPPVVDVERCAAALFGLDDAFYFASGWMGNNILVQLIEILVPSYGAECGLVLVDECSHYSVFEAARVRNWPHVTFGHRDPDDLRAKLKEHLKPGQSPLVLSDGVFAATGRIAPVGEYFEILRCYPGSALCLDDAHGVAVVGENGRGTFEHAGLWRYGVNAVAGSAPPCPALLFSGTLSKAVGGYGGIVPGSTEFIRRVKSRSAYFGGTSPPPAPIAAASARAIELIMADPGLRTRLWSNARLLKDGLRQLGFDVDDTPVPIVALTIGDAGNMQRVQRALMERGITVAYMAAYSGLGPEGALRIAVFATHTEEMIGQLLDELRRLV
jgi:8-amino-7-oxononanoate synthase